MSRVFSLVTVAAVLVIAWCAGRDQVEIGVAAAVLGLAMAYSRPLLAIPAAAGMAAAAIYLPGVVAVFLLGALLVGIGSMGGYSNPESNWDPLG